MVLKKRNKVEAHDQRVTHGYSIHYPAHDAREGDPHYRDFDHLRKKLKADPERWKCAVGVHRGDFTECDLLHPLELHHAHVEFALANNVELTWLAKDYPGIDTPEEVGQWVESADNLMVLCAYHHRGHAGIHVASAADFEAEKYVRGLIS